MKKFLVMALTCMCILAVPAVSFADTDTAEAVEESGSGSVEESGDEDPQEETGEVEPVEISEGRYSYYMENSGLNDCYYSVVLHNPNKDYAVRDPEVQVVLRSEDGKIMKVYNQILPDIAAGDTVTYGDSFTFEGKEPASVDMHLSYSADSYVLQDTWHVPSQKDFPVSNTARNAGQFYTSITGEVTNNSDADQENLRVIVIFKKDGVSIGGTARNIGVVIDGQTKAFEVQIGDIMDYDAYTVYALGGDWVLG